jgi:tripartite-type tricarboxylate transporter receptor subunit TctC
MKASWTFMLAWLLAVAAVAKADAQTGPYPNKPVQIITNSSAGSTPDVALRFVADGLTQALAHGSSELTIVKLRGERERLRRRSCASQSTT